MFGSNLPYTRHQKRNWLVGDINMFKMGGIFFNLFEYDQQVGNAYLY